LDQQLELPIQEGHGPPEPFTTVIKRDGREEPFVRTKIRDAIFKAAERAGTADRDVADSLASAVMIYLTRLLGSQPPSVDQIHDAVERVLVHMSHAKTALAYARYRDRRARIRRFREGDLRTLLAELEEAREAREALGGHPGRVLFVRTSDDTLAAWRPARIAEALERETGLDRAMAMVIAMEVEQQIEKAHISALTVSLVRELVSAKLVEHGLEDHRSRHRRLGLPLHDTDQVIRGITAEDPGADPHTTDQLLARAVKKEYALSQVFSPVAADAHMRGELHLHHLGLIDRLFTAEFSIAHVARHGINVPEARDFATPAKHAPILLAQVVKFHRILQRYFADLVGWDAVNVFLAPYLQEMDQRTLEQFAQMLVYEFAYQALTHGEGVTSAEIGLYWQVPERLRDELAVGPGGVPTGQTYGACEHTAQQFAWAVLEVLLQGSGTGGPFPSPIPRIHLGLDFFKAPGHERFLRLAAQLSAVRRPVRFVLNRDSEDAAPIRAAHPWQPVAHLVSLNLCRAAYGCSRQDEFLARLDELLEAAITAHSEKRGFLEELLARPDCSPLQLLGADYDGAPYLELDACAYGIAVNGLSECTAWLLAESPSVPEALELGQRILQHVQDRCALRAGQTGLNLVLTENHDREVSWRFASLDANDFPESARRVMGYDAATQRMQYTLGVRLPVGHGLTPVEQARLEGQYHAWLDERASSILELPEDVQSAESIADFLRKIHQQTTCRRLEFVPAGNLNDLGAPAYLARD
jgi:ribonucleoside-triphosphate reductase